MVNSIVDLLKSQGKDSSYQARSSMFGAGYTGSAQQNMELLKRAQAPAAPVAPAAPKYVAPSVAAPKQPSMSPIKPAVTPNTMDTSTGAPVGASPSYNQNPGGNAITNPNPKTPEQNITDSRRTREEIVRAQNPGIDQENLNALVDKMTPQNEKDFNKGAGQQVTGGQPAEQPNAPQKPQTPEEMAAYGEQNILPQNVTGIGQTVAQIEEKRKSDSEAAKTNLMTILSQDPNSPQLEAYIKRFPALRNEFMSMQRNALSGKGNFDLAMSMSTKTPEQLNESIIAGAIVPGTEAWNRLVETNPTLVNSWAVFQKDKIVADLINKKYNVNPFDTTKISGQILNQLMGTVMNSNALVDYDSFVNSEAVTNASNEIKNVEQELITTGEQINQIDVDVRWELPAGVPEAVIAGEVANRQKGLYTKVTALEQRRQSLGENYSRMVEMATKRFEVYQADKTMKQNFLMEAYGVAAAEEVRYEDMERTDQELARNIQLEEVEYQRDIARQDFTAAEERRLAIDDMKEDRTYNEDLFLDRSLIEAGVNPVGLTRDEKTAKLSVAMKNQNLLAAAKGNKTTDTGYTTTAKYDPVQNEDGTISMNATSKYSVSVNDDGSIKVNIEEGTRPKRGQCGEFVNDFFWVQSLFKDTLSQKMRVKNSDEPVVGGAFIEDVGTLNGHVGIVESIDPDGTLHIVDSNYSNNNDETIRRDTISPNDPRYAQIVGFYDPSQDAGSSVEITDADRTRFNRRTFKPETLKTAEDKAKFDKFLEEWSVFDDPDADIFDILDASIGGTQGTKDERAQISKYSQALGGLQGLSETLSGMNTGPIIGRLRKLDPYNVDTASVVAMVQGLVPTVARGVFNEVGVLTDEDVKRYLGTLPSLTNTDDQNRAITGILLTTLKNGMQNNLSILARNGIDVSKMTGYLKKIDNQIKNINKAIGISDKPTNWNYQFSENVSTIEQILNPQDGLDLLLPQITADNEEYQARMNRNK